MHPPGKGVIWLLQKCAKNLFTQIGHYMYMFI